MKPAGPWPELPLPNLPNQKPWFIVRGPGHDFRSRARRTCRSSSPGPVIVDRGSWIVDRGNLELAWSARNRIPKKAIPWSARNRIPAKTRVSGDRGSWKFRSDRGSWIVNRTGTPLIRARLFTGARARAREDFPAQRVSLHSGKGAGFTQTIL